MKKIIFSIGLVLLYACADRSQGQRHADDRGVRVEEECVVLAADSPIRERIKTQSIHFSDYQAAFTTSGVVQAILTGYAEIASPFAGRIVKSFVRLGQQVVPGSPVFSISSPSFFETGKAYYQAKQEMELALKSLNREKDLLRNNVGVAKEVEEAEVNYELRKKDYENALAALSVFQIEPEKMTLGQPLVITSPIAGEIVKNNIVIGQYIKEDAGPLALVADLNKVWVVAHVKEKDIPLIRRLNRADIRLMAVPDTVFSGTVYHVSELLDEETRSVEVIIECDNRDRRLKPFMYGTVQLTDTPSRALVIPTSAILQREDDCYVLVRESEDRYRKVRISVSSSDERQTVVSSGLGDGDKVVTEGAFYLIDAR